MPKALTLALALAAAGRAQAAGAAPETGGESGLVVSALFGTEPPSYVHAAVANVLGFTLSGSTRERDALASPSESSAAP